jgi:hypothetical protein
MDAPKRGPGRPRKPPSALLTVRIPPAELAAYAAKAAEGHEFLSVVVRRLLEAWLRGHAPHQVHATPSSSTVTNQR